MVRKFFPNHLKQEKQKMGGMWRTVDKKGSKSFLVFLNFCSLCFNAVKLDLVFIGGFKMRRKFDLSVLLSFFILLFFVLNCTSVRGSQLEGLSESQEGVWTLGLAGLWRYQILC